MAAKNTKPEAEPQPEPEPHNPFDSAAFDDRPRNPDGTFASSKPQETPEAEPNPPQPEPSRHPASLLALAKEYGFDDDDIEAMPPDNLLRAVRRAAQQEREITRQFSTQRALTESPRQQAPTPPAPELGDDENIDLSGEEFNQYDPTVMKAVRKLLKDNKELKERLAGIEDSTKRRAVNSTFDHIDAAFEALGPEYEHIFGKGSAAEFDADQQQSELLRRKAVLQQAGIDTETPPTQIRRKILRTVSILYGSFVGQKPASPTPPAKPAEKPNPYFDQAKKPVRQVGEREWQNGGVLPPTSRDGAAELKGEALAIRNLSKRMGENSEAGDQEILDTLL